MKELIFEWLLPKQYTSIKDIFCQDLLYKVHGPSLVVGDWITNQRVLKFEINVRNVPSVLRRFLCGPILKITVNQVADDTVLKSSIKMHFVGSEFFSIKPTYYLEGEHLKGIITHNTLLPWPISKVAENFMLYHSQQEIAKLKAILIS